MFVTHDGRNSKNSSTSKLATAVIRVTIAAQTSVNAKCCISIDPKPQTLNP